MIEGLFLFILFLIFYYVLENKSIFIFFFFGFLYTIMPGLIKDKIIIFYY